MTIFLAALAEGRRTFLERSAEHVVDGLVFAFKAMGVVLPIAGFFFIGNGEFSGRILGIPPNADGTPAGPRSCSTWCCTRSPTCRRTRSLPRSRVLVIGMIAGLEGSGFSGLPLTGSLAGTLGPATGVEQRDPRRDRPDGQHLVRRRHPGRVELADRGRWVRPGAR